MMLRSSLIIPTYNRPRELSVALASVLRQTRLPDQVVIIDDGKLEAIPHRQSLESAGIEVLYQRKAIPDLPTSRNIGIGISNGEVILFLDDDVELEPDYIEQLLAPLEADREGLIAGVGGRILNFRKLRPAHRLRRLFDRLFLVSGPLEGRVLPSGFTTNYGSTFDPPETPYRVDVISGGVAAWRRRVFEEFQFSENYRVHCAGEDQDFSYRVSRRHPLLFNPRAGLRHFEAPAMRHDRHSSARRFLFDRYRFFRNYVRRWPLQTGLFWWAVTGYTLSRLAVALVRPGPEELSRVRGIFSAIRDILRGKLPWDAPTAAPLSRPE